MTLLLHRIESVKVNSNFNTPEEVAAATDRLTFDGIYTSVYQYQDLLRGREGVILFVSGKYMGGDNSFDEGQPPAKFCTWEEVRELERIHGCEIGWHTFSHRDLTQLSDEELKKEVTPPFPMKKFAYPYGRFDDRVIQAVKDAGFEEAFGVFDGDGSEFQRLRSYL